MGISAGPDMIQNGLVLALDAADRNSYISGSTTWTDISGNNTNGTLINGPTFSSANGGSLFFDGTNDYITLPSTIIPATSNWTYSSFFNFNQLVTGSVLYSQYIAIGNNGRLIIRLSDAVQNTSQFALFLGSGTGYSSTSIYTNTTASINTNYNLTIVRSSQYTYNIYVNGVFDTGSTTAFTANILQTTPVIGGINIGGVNPTPATADFLNGRIYSTTIYNRALSAQEVLQNYNATKTRFGL